MLIYFSCLAYVCVAQLDRASGYGPEGRGFESFHTRYLRGLVNKSYQSFFYCLRVNCFVLLMYVSGLKTLSEAR